MSILALGPPEVRVDGQVLANSLWESRHALSLLVVLAEQCGRPVESDFLIRTLWPQAECGKGALHATVSRVRRAFKGFPGQPALPSVLVFKRGLYGVGLDYALDYDVARLESICRHASGCHSESLYERVEAALQLWRGPFMSGYSDSWITMRRNHLEQTLDQALQKIIRCPQLAERSSAMVGVFHRLLERSPCYETAHKGLVVSLLHLGQVDSAKREVHNYRAALKDHLQTLPGKALLDFWAQNLLL